MGYFFLFSSAVVLLMYRNATNFYMLISYPTALLNSSVSLVFWLPLGFSLYKITSSAKNGNFTFCFSIRILFYFLLAFFPIPILICLLICCSLISLYIRDRNTVYIKGVCLSYAIGTHCCLLD